MGAGLVSNVAEMIEPVLGAMGYELVDVEFGAAGLLRVTIDVAGGARPIQVEDCERVSHQLSRLFLVENLDYDRLEISSPGLDRPLKRPADFARFAGEKVMLRLRQPVGGRKQFTGVLLSESSARKQALAAGLEVPLPVAGAEDSSDPVASRDGESGADRWVLIWRDDPEPAGGRRTRGAGVPRSAQARRKGAASKAAAGVDGAVRPPDGHWLAFTLDQIEKARLVPKLVF